MKKLFLLFVTIASTLILSFVNTMTIRGVEFDGTDDVINCGSASSIDTVRPFTISAWINSQTAGEASTGRIYDKGNIVRFFVSNQDGVPPDQNVLRFDHVTSGTVLIVRSSVNSFEYNKWVHVAVTWDGSLTATNVHLYMNGVETAYETQQNGTGSLSSDASSSGLIGNRSTGDRTFDGSISELAVWNAVLTAYEIALLAKSRIKGIPLQIQPSNLKAYWPLDEFADGATASGAGSIKDLSGNGNHGTPSNSPVGRAERVLSYPW